MYSPLRLLLRKIWIPESDYSGNQINIFLLALGYQFFDIFYITDPRVYFQHLFRLHLICNSAFVIFDVNDHGV